MRRAWRWFVGLLPDTNRGFLKLAAWILGYVVFTGWLVLVLVAFFDAPDEREVQRAIERAEHQRDRLELVHILLNAAVEDRLEAVDAEIERLDRELEGMSSR